MARLGQKSSPVLKGVKSNEDIVTCAKPSHRATTRFYPACNIQSFQIENCYVIISRDCDECARPARFDQNPFRRFPESKPLHLLSGSGIENDQLSAFEIAYKDMFAIGSEL